MVQVCGSYLNIYFGYGTLEIYQSDVIQKTVSFMHLSTFSPPPSQ
jgi:hypothetical protein